MGKDEKIIENLYFLAKVYGWQVIKTSKLSGMISFKRKGTRINIWYLKMTVGTALKHPIYGNTQLFRKNVSMNLMEKIFENPRVHTNKRYSFKCYKNYKNWKNDKITTTGKKN